MVHYHCYDCGLQYGGDAWVEAIIPDKIWNKIRPTECKKDCGILCISCITRRLNILGYKDVPVWLCGTEPLKIISDDPSKSFDMIRNWNQII